MDGKEDVLRRKKGENKEGYEDFREYDNNGLR